MKKVFLPYLNTQTNSNLSWSFLTISRLVDFWEKLGEKNRTNYLAIADYYPYEISNFFRLCKEKKIKPIWGVKIFLFSEKKNYSATTYPRNNKGYKEIITRLFSPDSPLDRVFKWDYIINSLNKDCIIVLEATQPEDIDYFASELILVSTEKKKSDVFIGLNFLLANPTYSLSAEIIPLLIPFVSIKVLDKEETELLKLWRKTNFRKHFFSIDVETNFLSYDNNEEVLSRCTNDLSVQQILLLNWQSFLTKINLNPNSLLEKKTKKGGGNNSLILTLKSKCWQKLLFLKKDPIEKYQKVLEKELEIIEKFDYVSYFLLFSEVVDYLRSQDIVFGPGRGSAVSSLTSYLLGITSVDPLQHGLFFERFLNEKREKLPDIDLDVESQEEVLAYLRKKYPKEQVARIVTRKKVGWKDSGLESYKVCKVYESDWREISNFLGERLSSNDLKVQRWKLRYPLFFSLIEKIHKLYYDTSIHPSGIVVSEQSLSGLVPLKPEKDFLLSFFEEDSLTILGLKKYDFLSLREAFGFISDIKEARISPDFKGSLQVKLPTYQEVDLQDKKTWKILTNFCLTGIFQLDTLSARKLFVSFRPQNFSELVLFLALNRPGTIKEASKIFKKKSRSEKPSFDSPDLQRILLETHGSIIFEEQVSQIFSLVFSCSFSESEVKRVSWLEKGLEKDFFVQAQKIFTRTDYEMISQSLSSARGYIFNKAHAVGYGFLTYYVAYLKANFFFELITYFLNKKREKTLNYLQEAFFLCNFSIKGPDINYSQLDWIRKEENLIMGFSSLKGYQVNFFSALIEERKNNGVFQNWENFSFRTSSLWKNIEINDFNKWVESGLFASLQVGVEILKENSVAIFRYFRIQQRLPLSTRDKLPFLELKATSSNQEKKKVINQREQENLGCYITYFSRWKKTMQNEKITTLLDIIQAQQVYSNQTLLANIYAVICQTERLNNDDWMLLLQDVRSSFRLVVSSQDYQTNQESLAVHNELIFTLRIEIAEGQIINTNLEKLKSLDS